MKHPKVLVETIFVSFHPFHLTGCFLSFWRVLSGYFPPRKGLFFLISLALRNEMLHSDIFLCKKAPCPEPEIRDTVCFSYDQDGME